MIEGIVEKLANKPLALRDGDFVRNGLAHCGRCGAPRECTVELFGKPRKVVCMCQCESDEYRQGQAAEDARKEQSRLHRLHTAGLQDRNYRQWTFDVDDGHTPQVTKARRYCEKWEQFYKKNTGLLLWGNVGTGKTFVAACIANELLQRGIPVMMTNFIRLANELSGFGNDKNAYIKSLDNYKLLLIDDLGAERESSYMQEQVYSIIDSRYRNGQPLIVTTNLTLKELQSPRDMTYARIYDRVLEMTVPVKFDGVERRKDIGRDKTREAARLLEG